MTASAQPRQKVIGPQPGPQTMFMSVDADIVIYGGGAGGGKTWGLLYEPMRHVLPTETHPNGVKDFTGVIFRRTSPQIRNEGGLWDESDTLYPDFGGDPRESILEWRFNGGDQTMRFASMQHETDKNDWQGAQIPYIGFDELCHFTEEMFFYLVSRNRSTCGVRPYMRATCNPDADVWVADFLAWWIDQDETSPTYGLALKERVGVVRFFVRVQGRVIWADTAEELFQYVPVPDELKDDPDFDQRNLVKSCTFIPSSVYDNKILLKTNPQYLGNLMALPLLERQRLLGMNWKVRATAGKVFNRAWFYGGEVADEVTGKLRRFTDHILHERPLVGKVVRYWDKAGTEDAGAFTAGVLLATFEKGVIILDVRRGQWSSYNRNQVMLQTAEDDHERYPNHIIWVEQEPGSGGKESAEASVKLLAGYTVRTERVTGDKLTRALPLSGQAEAGNVYLLAAEWNYSFVEEHHNFPEARLKDQVDAASGAHNKVRRRAVIDPKMWKAMYR